MLDSDLLARVLGRALRRGGDFADVFFENRLVQTFRLQDGRIREASSALVRGAGVRVVVGERAGYAYSDDLEEAALLRAAEAASLIARDSGAHERVVTLAAHAAPALYDAHPDEPADSARYVELLARADVAARAFDPRVVAVNAFVMDELQHVQIADSEGRIVTDRRPLVALGVQVVAKDGAQRENGYLGDGGRTAIDVFETKTPESLACESARIATTKLGAREAPAGEMPVVIGAGGGGVLLHEAVGHGLEADFNRKGTSLYSGRIGERVASDLVTIFDDGDLPGERGTVAVDDEGTPGQHKVLVERGILRGYMQDRLNARLMGVGSTGSGRRESFRVLPQPRMCNTYMPPGSSTPDGDRRLDRPRSVRGLVQRRAGRDQQGRFRVHDRRGLSDRRRADHRAGARRDADRQRPRRDDESDDGRRRRAARAPLVHLRQRRAARPGRCRDSDGEAVVVHGRRDRWLIRATRRWRSPTSRSPRCGRPARPTPTRR